MKIIYNPLRNFQGFIIMLMYGEWFIETRQLKDKLQYFSCNGKSFKNQNFQRYITKE